MLHLIPAVKHLETTETLFCKKPLSFDASSVDPRVAKAVALLPLDESGIPLTVTVTGDEGEGYTLALDNASVCITAKSDAGAFYAV